MAPAATRIDMTTPFDGALHRNPDALASSDQRHSLASPFVLGARFLQARFGFLSFNVQADAFFPSRPGA